VLPPRLLLSPGGIKLPFAAHRQAQRWLDRAAGFATADLLRRPSGWWLHLVVDIKPPEFVPSDGVVGIDPALTARP
jgi:hypothetical protein